jgi:hypothetical protein
MWNRFVPIKVGKNVICYSHSTHKTVNNISNDEPATTNKGSVGIANGGPPPSIPFVPEASKIKGGMLLNTINLKNGRRKKEAPASNLSFVF